MKPKHAESGTASDKGKTGANLADSESQRQKQTVTAGHCAFRAQFSGRQYGKSMEQARALAEAAKGFTSIDIKVMPHESYIEAMELIRRAQIICNGVLNVDPAKHPFASEIALLSIDIKAYLSTLGNYG